jgi:hypothetical protein
LIHLKAKKQFAHVFPGGSWNAPSAMSNFLRELHIRAEGTLPNVHMGLGDVDEL